MLYLCFIICRRNNSFEKWEVYILCSKKTLKIYRIKIKIKIKLLYLKNVKECRQKRDIYYIKKEESKIIIMKKI